MEHMNESFENERPTNYFLLETAVGTIEAGPEQQERLNELTERLSSGEFHAPVESTDMCKCIDGRSGGYGLYPNSAGGCESLMVADDLTFKKFAGESSETVDEFRAMTDFLRQQQIEIGVHTDSHADGDASGCGANDKLPIIYEYIAQRSEVLRKLSKKLGVEVPDSVHEMIVQNAAERQTFSTGRELLKVVEETGSAHIETLEGVHNEVAAVINTVEGSTLDRMALQQEFGETYQAFNVDVWAFESAAQAISQSNEEKQANVAAMVYYNLATAHVLCGPNMRVVVR